jgi:hypothetical protein
MLPAFSSHFFAVFDSSYLKYGSGAHVSTGIIQAAEQGLVQTVVQNEATTTRITKGRNRCLALSVKKHVHAIHCALNGIPFSENSPILAICEPEEVTLEMAAEYQRTLQKSVKMVVPVLFEAILVHHFPTKVMKLNIYFLSLFQS